MQLHRPGDICQYDSGMRAAFNWTGMFMDLEEGIAGWRARTEHRTQTGETGNARRQAPPWAPANEEENEISACIESSPARFSRFCISPTSMSPSRIARRSGDLELTVIIRGMMKPHFQRRKTTIVAGLLS